MSCKIEGFPFMLVAGKQELAAYMGENWTVTRNSGDTSLAFVIQLSDSDSALLDKHAVKPETLSYKRRFLPLYTLRITRDVDSELPTYTAYQNEQHGMLSRHEIITLRHALAAEGGNAVNWFMELGKKEGYSGDDQWVREARNSMTAATYDELVAQQAFLVYHHSEKLGERFYITNRYVASQIWEGISPVADSATNRVASGEPTEELPVEDTGPFETVDRNLLKIWKPSRRNMAPDWALLWIKLYIFEHGTSPSFEKSVLVLWPNNTVTREPEAIMKPRFSDYQCYVS